MDPTVCLRGLSRPLWLLLFSGCVAGGARYDALVRDLHRATRAPVPDGDPFAGAKTLDRRALIGAVLARNPDVAAAREAWRAAVERFPQETSLDAPMLSYRLAPLSLGGSARFGEEIAISEKLPVFGERRLRGDVALAEAEAARDDLDTTRLELAVMAAGLYDDYFVVAQATAINEAHRTLVTELQKSATIEYTAGRAAQQDPLQAEVELARLEQERIGLESQRAIVVAQLDGLLHRAPDAPLPPSPTELPAPDTVSEDRAALEAEALRARPDLLAAHARAAGREAGVRVAKRAFYPDVEVMASYSSMWDTPEHWVMLGVSFAIPLDRGRRRAAVREAEAEAARASDQITALEDRVRVEVTRGVRAVAESRHVVMLYEDRLLPATRDQVAAARAGFVAGNTTFVAVIEAERGLRSAELDAIRARAELDRRVAELERTIGRVPGLGDGDAP